ncbi:MAG: TIGR01212 family radical SAM protein [Planctomycetota bacterium]|nr:TIGR01212 family radical SAM protein [Planctomycetota bacterium]
MLFYSFKKYLKEKFPAHRVYKISLDAGFSCPHRTPSTRVGGCIYCENRSFSPYTRLEKRPPLEEQIQKSMEFYRKRYKADKFIIYFQAYTNTLAPIEHLRPLYDSALVHPDIVGLAIGTRPDCVPDSVLDLISEYAKKYLVWLEYGLQSAHDKTLDFINRGHKYSDYESAIKRTKERKNISIATHLILGLPGEGKREMIESVEKVIALGIDGIKLHHLYIARNTRLAELYEQNLITLLTLSEYIQLVCDIIEMLPPEMVVIRVTGELSGEYLIAPKWGVNKNQAIQMIEKELSSRASYQGKNYS